MSAQQQKAHPLTKKEVMMLLDLIEAHPVLFSKATNNATSNQLKDVIWMKITARFNSMIASNPRKPDQLRLKWENLKKCARKRSINIKMNNSEAGNGKPYLALDRVASMLGLSRDGHSVPFRDDVTPQHTPATPKKLSIYSAHSKGKLRRSPAQPSPAPADDTKASVILKNRAIAEYYEAKKKQEGVLAILKKRKLELEILELERKNCPDPLGQQ